MYLEILFFLLFAIVAFLYSSVGHGGASGYLAIMAFFSFAPETMRSTVLIINIFVSLIAFVQYFRGGYFSWSLFWPFALGSFPAAFLGGFIKIDVAIYKYILAVVLLISAIQLFGTRFKFKQFDINFDNILALAVGAIIGLFSGIMGIGGGIILSPVILFFAWADMKKTAAVSALFIFANSVAGLGGVLMEGYVLESKSVLMIIVALLGGAGGAYFGANKLSGLVLRKFLAIVLLIACVKLVIT